MIEPLVKAKADLLFDIVLLPSIIDRICKQCPNKWNFAKLSQDKQRIMLGCKLKHIEVIEIRNLEDVTQTIISQLNYHSPGYAPKLSEKAKHQAADFSRKWDTTKTQLPQQNPDRNHGNNQGKK